MTTIRAILQLIRLPNLVTAAADAFAGFLFIGLGFDRLADGMLAATASICFYAAGVAFNDVCDAKVDAAERPNRPIPSGRVALTTAIAMTAALFAVGLLCCAKINTQAVRVGSGLIICIVAYDSFFKRTPFAPAIMGACRGLNLWLGMSVIGGQLPTAGWYAVAVMWLYVTSLTFFARQEARLSDKNRLRAGRFGVAAAVAALIGLQSFIEQSNSWYLLLVGVLMGQVLTVSQPAVRTGQPEHVQRAVKTFVLSIIILDACFVFAARGPLPAAIIAALIIPAIWLASAFRVT